MIAESHTSRLTASAMQAVLVLLFSMLLLFQTACGHDNPLYGSWVLDSERTLRNLQVPETGPEHLLETALKIRKILENSSSGSDLRIVFSYRKGELEQVMYASDGKVLSKETAPVAYQDVQNNHVSLVRLDHGGDEEFFFEDDGSMYVKLQIGGFHWKEYYSRSSD